MTIDELWAECEQLSNDIEKINNEINDQEQEILDEYSELSIPTDVSVTTNSVSTSGGSYHLGFDRAPANMEKVSKEELTQYFLSHGGTQINDNTYAINIDGKNYQYNINTESVTVNGENYIGCRFYKTPNTQLGNINNTITILPGSGETRYGAVKRNNDDNKNALPNNININDGSLVIVPYFQKEDYYNMYRQADKVIPATYLGNFMACGSTTTTNHVRNSIVGYSMGATASFPLICEAPQNYFSSLVAVDLGSYMQKMDGSYFNTISESDYSKMTDMEFIFMSSDGNDPWQDKSMAQTYHNLKKYGAQNIVFYTNADKTLNPNIGNGVYYVEDAVDTSNQWTYSSHNHGYQIINDTNILSYLSR